MGVREEKDTQGVEREDQAIYIKFLQLNAENQNIVLERIEKLIAKQSD